MAKAPAISRSGHNNSAHSHSPYHYQRVEPTSRLPLKILMTSDTLSGVWANSIELAQALSKNGHQIALATMGRPLSTKQHWEIEQILGVTLFERPFKLEWMDNPWSDLEAAGEWLLCLEQQLQPHLIHLNGYAHGALPWQAPTVIAGYPCALSWRQGIKSRTALPTWKLQHYIKRSLQTADIVLAPNQATLSALKRDYGPLPHSRLAPHGRRSSPLECHKKELFVLTMGGVEHRTESIATLETVAPMLPWPIGLADEENGFAGHSLQLHHLKQLGSLSFEQLMPWIDRASIFTSLAPAGPFDVPTLEAALAECALVLADRPDLRQVWGDAALYVPPEDPAALEVALVLLMIDPMYRQIMTKRARRQAQRLASEHMAVNYLALYQELLASPHSC
jgi:glycogen synthase